MMIVQQLLWPMVLVGLPTVNSLEIKLNKHNYTTPSADCQLTKNKNSLEHNYIKQTEFIESSILKFQDILP